MQRSKPVLSPKLPTVSNKLKSRIEAFGGDVICPDDVRYEQARLVFNRIHNHYPRALVRTRNPRLIQEVAHYCEDHGLPLALRGGGHHIGGGSGGDGGIVLDLSVFRAVNYCRESGICRVQPGARLADVDRELTRYGRVVPTGTVSDTGVAGLTLGGGIGWLCGPLGLTCDHLVGADVLLRDGSVVQVENEESQGILWALRGGGGVGIVTEFRYRTSLLPTVAMGTIIIDVDVSKNLASLFSFLAASCPRELTVAPMLSRDQLTVEYCSTGKDQSGLEALLGVLSAGKHIPFEGSFVSWQSHIDGDFLPPERGYWKACYLQSFGVGDAQKLTEIIAAAPSSRCSILIEHLHGAFSEVPEGSSAFPLRTARFGVLLSARWPDQTSDEIHSRWVQNGYSYLDPERRSATYANYASADDSRAAAAFSEKARSRLKDLRSRYDYPTLATRPGGFERLASRRGKS